MDTQFKRKNDLINFDPMSPVWRNIKGSLIFRVFMKGNTGYGNRFKTIVPIEIPALTIVTSDTLVVLNLQPDRFKREAVEFES